MLSLMPLRLSLRSIVVTFACTLVALATGARADAADEFAIRSAYLVPIQGVYHLNAKLHFELPDGARQAIQDGVALTLHAEIELQRARRWWLDDTVATLEQNYEVVYHALSENYLLRNVNSGEQTVFGTFDAALEALGTLHDLPVIDQSLLNPQEQYEARLRATLDVRTLPEALRMVLFWADNWRQRTDWYLWPLKQ
jgi:Domain of unknown function (DUF4390)